MKCAFCFIIKAKQKQRADVKSTKYGESNIGKDIESERYLPHYFSLDLEYSWTFSENF